MSNIVNNTPARTLRWVRPALWGLAAALLALPAVAMRFTSEVQWTAGDFIVMGLLIGGTGLLIELGVRLSPHWAYRAGSALAALTGFFIIWVNLAVGIIGNEDNVLNTLFIAVLAMALAGAIIARFRAHGLRRALMVTAVAQVGVAIAAATQGYNIVPITVILSGLWLSAAALFGRAAEEQG
jgi:hypothetical protein